MDGPTLLARPSQARGEGRIRRGARRALSNTKVGTGRIERQYQRIRILGVRHERAMAAIAAATMLSLLPVRKSLAALDGRFATHTLLPSCWRSADDPPLPVGFRTYSGTESRLPRDREDPCSFRTRLIDPVAAGAADLEPEMDVEGADIPDDNDLKFDDTQCISIGRSTSNVKPASGAPSFSSHGREDRRTEIDNDSSDDDNDDAMETVNMPFWNIPKREKRHSAYSASDSIPDDMSIISDASLIPTYFPRQQQQRPQHRALIRRLFRVKARAARETMRELKRSCRDAVGTVFIEASTGRVPKCVAMGAAP
ncbi:hypothetical protein C8A05DRAFT_40947 [Staphylotrichum tortipilum]|uniref:Uncharacterized protein n=1 Tax=Staphylotrichum tortipilum TaxID=2831512 RepID=A0AAN6MT78_9PEZI|nr:hypothetical protein C8A05DRAFT_40947 [Staphylotrichum longicolle]